MATFKILNADRLNEIADRLAGCAALLDACIETFGDDTINDPLSVISEALTNSRRELNAYLSSAAGYQSELQKPKALPAYKTCELVEELCKREGVITKIAEPYQDTEIKASGPAIILVVTD